LPDGTLVLTNSPIRSILLGAAPVAVREAKNVPDWVNQDRFDITLKPPAGSSRDQQREMMQVMFAERMKLVAHVEQQDMTTYALVIGTPDRSLGPNLKQSTQSCQPPAPPEMCFLRVGNGVLDAAGQPLAGFARTISGLAGGQVIDRTGLTGRYDISLRFAALNGSNSDALPFAQALQAQLGLTLLPETTKQPVLVIDHIEPPTVDQ
jgi:uncharacterized protein (TIGR03435 family)